MIQIKDLHKSYKMGKNSLHVLKGINFNVEETLSSIPLNNLNNNNNITNKHQQTTTVKQLHK